MAPKVPANKATEERPRSRSPKGEAKPAAEAKEEKYQEPDAKSDSRPALKESIKFETAETTLNVVPTLGGKLLTSLAEGGMSCFLAGARGNVAQKAGRYMFEAKILQNLEQQGGGKQSRACLRLGFSTSSSSLILGEAGSVCFDNEGQFMADKKRQQMKGNARIASQQVMAVVLNLDSKSPNVNTIALYRDGVAVGEPMPLPDELKDKPLFPHVTFRNVSVATNFGPAALKELPFKCRLLGAAAASDCTVAASKEPKDGKYEVVMPVAFPDEGTFDWVDGFLEKNPSYVELSDRSLAKWAKASGIWGKGKNASNDKPDLEFGLPGQGGNSLRRVLNSVAPVVPRNYLIMEVKSNLLAADRKEVLKRFNYPCYKKIAHVVMGEPSKEHKALVQKTLLKKKQEKADLQWKAKVSEIQRKKVIAQKQKDLVKARKEAEKKRQAVLAEKKAEAAKAKGEEVKEEEKKDEPMEEEEKVAEEPEPEQPVAELTDDEKKVFFLPKSTPDLTQQVMNASFGKFSTPEASEGFDDVRYEWQKGDKAADYLKKWIMEKKLTTRVDDLKPGQAFKEKKAEFDKLVKEWQAKLTAFKAGPKKAKKAGDDVDIFSVDDVSDAGNGVPLYENFTFEDWELVKLQFEFGMLIQSFKKDTGDEDRVGIPMDHLSFYFSKYYSKGIAPKTYGVADTKELLGLVKSVVATKDGLAVSQLSDDIDNLDLFVKLTEEGRRERCRRIEAGDETARLHFVAPKAAPAKPEVKVAATTTAAAKPDVGKLGATAAPKASAVQQSNLKGAGKKK